MARDRRFQFVGKGRAAVTIDGLTEAKAALEFLPEAFRQEVALTIERGALIIAAEADARVPFDEGDLQASGDMHIRADGLQATVGYGSPYARWVEFSTEDTPAQPFLWPAFQLGARYVRKQMRTWGEAVARKVRTRTKRRVRGDERGWKNG
jgi:HK97 gp10 family phage protein